MQKRIVGGKVLSGQCYRVGVTNAKATAAPGKVITKYDVQLELPGA